MTVVIVADVLGKENNGTTVACMNLVRYLMKNGDTVRIVCCDKDKFDNDNFYIVPTINLGSVINYFVAKNEVSLAKADERVLRKAIKGADVVHVMIPFALGNRAIKIAKEYGIPVTAGFHCQAENFTSHLALMNNQLANKLTYRVFYENTYKNVDAVHYPTKFMEDTFESSVGHKTNAYVISNGVNDRFVSKHVEKPDNLKDKFVILFIGRYSREKSHKVLIEAVAKSKYKDKIQLIFAGSGPRREQLQKCIDKCGIPQPIMTFFSRDELVNVINYSDLYCHPAEIELEGIACLEAIRCGLVPVIADSKRCATKEFALDRNNLFKVNDSDDLAKKIDFWIENKELKDRYKEKYIKNSAVYRQEDCMYMMRNMLLDVTGNCQ